MNIFSNSAKKEREKYLREKQNDREKHIYNKPINNYQQFIRDNQKRIKEEFPELSYTERFSKLAALWKLEKKIKEDFPELLRKKELKDAKLFAPELFEKFPNRSEKYLEIYMSNSYLNNSRQKVIDNFLKQFNDLIKFLQKSFIECFVAYKTYIKNNDKDSEYAFKYYIQKNSPDNIYKIVNKMKFEVAVAGPYLKNRMLNDVIKIRLFKYDSIIFKLKVDYSNNKRTQTKIIESEMRPFILSNDIKYIYDDIKERFSKIDFDFFVSLNNNKCEHLNLIIKDLTFKQYLAFKLYNKLCKSKLFLYKEDMITEPQFKIVEKINNDYKIVLNNIDAKIFIDNCKTKWKLLKYMNTGSKDSPKSSSSKTSSKTFPKSPKVSSKASSKASFVLPPFYTLG